MKFFSGVIYLHDISAVRTMRTLRTPRTNFDMFRKLCGEKAEAAVIIGTTKWSEVKHDVGERREAELRNADWREIILGGLGVRRFEDSQRSAQSIVNAILDRVEQKNAVVEPRRLDNSEYSARSLVEIFDSRVEPKIPVGEVLQIQRELADLQRYIPETDAGNTLRYNFMQVLEMQEKITEELKAQHGAGGDSYMLAKKLRERWDQLKKAFKQIRDAILPFRSSPAGAVSSLTVSTLLIHENNCPAV
jgi:hypothetical protein